MHLLWVLGIIEPKEICHYDIVFQEHCSSHKKKPRAPKHQKPLLCQNALFSWSYTTLLLRLKMCGYRISEPALVSYWICSDLKYSLTVLHSIILFPWKCNSVWKNHMKLENTGHPNALLSEIVFWGYEQKLMKYHSSVLKIIHIFEVNANAYFPRFQSGKV